jgi:FMN reductase
VVVRAAELGGAETLVIPAQELELPAYVPEKTHRAPQAARLIEAIRRSDAMILASPGYFGSLSGLVKNARDYAEDLRDDTRTYFHGRAVSCIATASGWQAAVADTRIRWYRNADPVLPSLCFPCTWWGSLLADALDRLPTA